MLAYVKKELYIMLDLKNIECRTCRFFNDFLFILIIFNIIAVFVESFGWLGAEHLSMLHTFEAVSVGIFTVEYIGRVWTADLYDKKYADGIAGRLQYMRSSLAIVDLLAILPFYLLIFPVDLRTLRVIRLVKMIKFFKLRRFFNGEYKL